MTEALKELMKLGFLESAILPSSAESAYAHQELARYTAHRDGAAWVKLPLGGERARWYDDQLDRTASSRSTRSSTPSPWD